MANGIFERPGRHGDITFGIRYQYHGKDIRETVGRKSQGFTKEMAKGALKSRLGDIAQGKFNLEQTKKAHLFSELVDKYLPHAESYKLSFKREKYAIEGLKRYFKGTRLSAITNWSIEKWKRERREQVKDSTVNRELTILKHMLKMGVRWELTTNNPSLGVSPFKVQESRFRYLEASEIPALLQSCLQQETSPWLYTLVILALNTGTRQGELLELRYEDIDMEQRLIYFGRTKNKRLKTMPMNDAVVEATQWHIENRYGDYLFLWPWGDRIGRTTVYEAFKAACQNAGVEGFRFHDLRHTVASYLVMNGVDLATVKELLGHQEIEMTLRYSHLAHGHKAKAIDRLGEVLKNFGSQLGADAETGTTCGSLAQSRHISTIRKGRGLAKTQQNQELNWWRRGELNPRPKAFRQK